jgi:hypothetical protein
MPTWRLMRTLLVGLLVAGTAAVIAATPASAGPVCPQFSLEPCDDGGPGDPTGPAGPPMEGMDPTVDMGPMDSIPTPNEPNRVCGNARFNQAVYVVPEWRIAYTYDVNLNICVAGTTISLLNAGRAVAVPSTPPDPRVMIENLGISIDQVGGQVTTALRVTFCPNGFCQLYIHTVRFVVFPWGNRIRASADFRWIN